MTIQCEIASSASMPRVVEMSHNSGRKQEQLLSQHIYPGLGIRREFCHDAASVPFSADSLVVSTDSFVVRPRKFPGGDIGKLAVFGSCNDVAMAAAKPQFLSLALILEEGLALQELDEILSSIKQAAELCQVQIIAGDTKVVERGAGDGIYINTTAFGYRLKPALDVHPYSIRDGDQVLISGDLGRHGLAILASRHGFEAGRDADLVSDCDSLVAVVEALCQADIELHCLRDMTRGGMVSSLHELATDSSLSCVIEEKSLRITAGVRAASDLLGVDPLYAANEGRFCLVLPASEVDAALTVLREFPVSRQAYHVGEFRHSDDSGLCPLILKGRFGGERLLPLLHYDQLPRIC